jgi:LmbE family N-acetylglucosaminyl deacetylase
MKFANSTAEIFVPDGKSVADALGRVTHLGIGAHQDDLEFNMFHGIVECFDSEAEWFGGVTCADGAGSSRIGPYANFTDEQMRAVRRREQNQAAIVGRFGVMIQLDHPSATVKNAGDHSLKNDLKKILVAARPSVVYTHNPADKHETHIAVFAATLQALRELPREQRPKKVLGCEGWRDLDWLADSEKVLLDVSARENLAFALNGIFDSQIAGGKRYDLAVMSRRRANATFQESHASDSAAQVSVAMDLTPLVADESLDVAEFVCGHVAKFQNDVRQKLRTHF